MSEHLLKELTRLNSHQHRDLECWRAKANWLELDNKRLQCELADIQTQAFNEGIKCAADTVRRQTAMASAWGGADNVANVILSMRKSDA
jgi:hypothetical protein